MIKIKAFDITLTVAAFAAVVFLLPADRDAVRIQEHKSQDASTQHNTSKTSAEQQLVRGNRLHSA